MLPDLSARGSMIRESEALADLRWPASHAVRNPSGKWTVPPATSPVATPSNPSRITYTARALKVLANCPALWNKTRRIFGTPRSIY